MYHSTEAQSLLSLTALINKTIDAKTIQNDLQLLQHEPATIDAINTFLTLCNGY